MKVYAKLNNLRVAPRKIGLVANLIKKMDVSDAINQLDTTIKGGSLPIKKLLESAISNGENNFGISRDNMYVFDVIVGAGPTLKRWMPKAYGRAGQILKRTSKIKLVLEEKVEGKDRKTKDQLEKEKQARIDARKKEEKEREKIREEAEKSDKSGKSGKLIKDAEDKSTKGGKVEKKGGITSRIFRRKSM